MWNQFFLMLVFFTIGLIILFAINYIQNSKAFSWSVNIGQFIVRLFIGASVAIIIALAVKYPWVIWAAMTVLAFLSNYWMSFLNKKKG